MTNSINVIVTEKDKIRITNQEQKWNAPRLVVLLLATLAVTCAVLWLLAEYSEHHVPV